MRGPWAALVVFTVTTWRPWELGMQMGAQGGTGQTSAGVTQSILLPLGSAGEEYLASSTVGGKGTKPFPSPLQDLPIFLS